MRVARSAVWLLPIVATCLLWIPAILHPAPSIRITMGEEGPINRYGEGQHLYNFLGWGEPERYGERSARRAGAAASFVIPWAFRLGAPLQLKITACGCGITDPLHLTINDTTLPLPTTNEWRTYQFQVMQRPSIHGADVYLKWESSGELGPLVHQVDVQPQRADGEIAGVLFTTLTVTIVVLLDRYRRTTGEQRHYNAAAVVWPAVLITSAVAGRLLYAPQLLPWAALVVLGSAAAVVVTVLTPLLHRRLLLWGLLLWMLAAPQVLGTWVLDDAFISLRYAKNLVAGAGLTFNPGGEVVEGYTNFLWTVLIAAGLAAGFEPVLTAQVLCTLLALATLLLVYHIADVWWPQHVWSLVPPLFLALNAAFVLYTARGSGMETALVTFLVLLAVWRIWQAETFGTALLAGVACGLVMLARPDGALVFMAAVGGMIVSARPLAPDHVSDEQSIYRSRRYRLAGLIAGLLLVYAPYFLWRYSYYGYLLPNTFYAKTGATLAQVVRGLHYTADFWALLLVVASGLLIFSGVALVWRGFRSHSASGPALTLWLFWLLTLLYVIAVGGDHFPLGRFFIPVLPPFALLITHGIATLCAQVPEKGTQVLPVPKSPISPTALLSLVLLTATIIAGAFQFPGSDSRLADTPVWREHKVTLKNAEYGYWLERNTPPDTAVSTGIAGALPYYAERHVIDALGLNDLHIAHTEVETMGQGVAGAEKTDVLYILDQQPDYIPMSSAGIFWEHVRFQQEYEVVEVAGPRGGTLQFFRRATPAKSQ